MAASGEDPHADAARAEVAAAVRLLGSTQPIAEVAIRRVLESGTNPWFVDRLAAAAIVDRVALPVLTRIGDAGFDLTQRPVDHAACRRVRIQELIPGMPLASASLADLRKALAQHNVLLVEVLDEIGAAAPFTTLIGYGLSVELANPANVARQSSDVDAFTPSLGDGRRLVDALVGSSGFALQASFLPRRSPDLAVWKLSTVREGHVLSVDLFAGGRANTSHAWVPPFRSPGLFPRARRLEGGPQVLVPAAADMLVMLAEKVLRKGEFTARRRSDGQAIVTGSQDLDWAVVGEEAALHHLELPLEWLVRQVAQVQPAGLGPGCSESAVPRVDRWLAARMTGSNRRSAQRARAVHRWLWCGRHVLGADDRLSAAREVVDGRYNADSVRAGRRLRSLESPDSERS